MRILFSKATSWFVTVGLWLWMADVALTAETLTWKSGAVGDWNDATHWNEGKPPRDGDNLFISGAGSRALLNKSSPTLGHVVIDESLIVSGWETTLRADFIEVRRGGSISMPEPFQNRDHAHRIQLECLGRLIVAAGAKINADALGFAGGVGTAAENDAKSAGFGPGAGGFPKFFGASAGGSYGGRGGTPSAMKVYGSLDEPTQSGSGGGGGKGSGGAGGGAIRIAAGEMTVDGVISANGGDVTTRTWSGGGSGGSVWLKCRSISGNGRIEANGGWGSVYAGGGGGGRVAIEAKNAGIESQVTFVALGGANGRCGYGVEEPANFGEPGTLWFSGPVIPGRVSPNSGIVVHGAQSGESKTVRLQTVAYWMPWKTNSPIVDVTKTLYHEHPRPRAAARTAREYVGPNLELCEMQSLEVLDDVGESIQSRWSSDNGRTWSEPVATQASNNVEYAGVKVWEGGLATNYDPTSKRLVQIWLRQIQQGQLYHNFSYSRTSRDLGRTWSSPTQMRYEEGPDFDPRKPLNEAFLNHNEAYYGSNILIHSSGVLLHCLAHTNAVNDPKNDSRPWRMGSRLMIGRWQADRREYAWTPGAAVEISPDRSARGLMEPDVAELKDNRILVVWRGSDRGWDGSKSKEPGRKWFSLSTDGGMTLSAPKPWHYDDGTPFYSSSSFHRFIRLGSNGKLYWLGNINVGVPNGNSPRYPLLIAEVDETTVTLKKQTISVVDDRDPNKNSLDFQLSNFSLFENRETYELELFLTAYGQVPGQAEWATADSFCYRLKLKSTAQPVTLPCE
ncbi:MAG: hypothetical protein K8U03_00405 [Planctomycetia bacterium]|nr:hypothetical protein [Planctomycetia bacterium]